MRLQDHYYMPSYNVDFFSIIENEAFRSGKTPFEVLLSEWGTMGRRRPTVRRLLIYCLELELLRAASHIAHEMMGCKS